MRPTRITKYEEIEVDFDIDDVIEFIERCNKDEIKTIRESLKIDSVIAPIESLYDREKSLILEAMFNKYTLEQLKIIANEAPVHTI
jgi:Mg/Co/Ni transporter MgtE